MNRVLLFGATGQLGDRILKQWSDIEIIAPARTAVDVTDYSCVMNVVSHEKPDLVVNATAFNDVVGAEKNLRACFNLNAVAVDYMLRACISSGAMFVTVSTDYVFDGQLGRPYTEADTPNPLSVYGISKFAGELLALRHGYPIYVIRTSGLYGTKVSSSKGYSFIDRILQQANDGVAELRVVDDQTVSPTYAGHLATALRTLIDTAAPAGIYHVANEGAVTWFEFASDILRQACLPTIVRHSATIATELPRRPQFSALKNARLRQIGLRMPDWRSGIRAYFQEKRAQKLDGMRA